jgi:diaminohydroxyphosphoribosylaminopyrimidine deaminase/5-amino-6-(5-phosphoribosylamino)uracil reductase
MVNPSTTTDHTHMAEALRLAARGLTTTHPNPRVGCVLVKDGAVVGRGWHVRAGGPHAEVLALREAGAAARGATAYVSLEPCCHQGRTPPCTTALIEAGVREVVAAHPDPNPKVSGQGLAALTAAGITVRHGVLAADAERLNAGFIKRMRTGRPLVRVKLGVSLDGRAALADGTSQWITGEPARADVQQWRARSDAILTGIGTVLADDPRLTRRDGSDHPQPLRVVLDSRLQLLPSARLFAEPGPVLVLTAAAPRALGAAVEVQQLAAGPDGHLDLGAVLDLLGAREINELLIEAGPTLAGAFVAAGLVDELIIYQAPVLLGDEARPALRLPRLARMDDRLELEVIERRMVGRDERITARVRPRSA